MERQRICVVHDENESRSFLFSSRIEVNVYIALFGREVDLWTERQIRAHVFLCVVALQVDRYMTSRLRPLNPTAQSALEKLRQIKAGHVVVNAAKTPVLTALNEGHRAVFRQLELPFPKIKQLQDL